MLVHRGCGGEVKPNWGRLYCCMNEDGTPRSMEPAQRCTRCKKEILGDSELDIVIDGEVVDVDGEWRDSGD